MQAPTTSPGTSFSTAQSNITKSKEQILIQSSGAMIAVIVLGVILILAILLIILKTYNRHTHVSRMLGTSAGSKSRQKNSTSTAVTQRSNAAARNPEIASVSGALHRQYGSMSDSGFRIPRAELSDTQRNDIEMFSTSDGGNTVVTIHDPMSLGNT